MIIRMQFVQMKFPNSFFILKNSFKKTNRNETNNSPFFNHSFSECYLEIIEFHIIIIIFLYHDLFIVT